MFWLLISLPQAPSPPHIHVPQAPEDKELVLQDYFGFQCNPEDREILGVITQGHHAAVGAKEWKYEWRRFAQPVLSFLYLGPSVAARDINMLKKEGITMLLVVRNTMMVGMLSGDKVAKQLGIEAASIDVAGNPQLIAAFPQAIKKINDHLISVFRQQVANGANPDDHNAWGKVLVFCESGNERSATVVAAYLMHMYNLDVVTALQYVQAQRFCVAFDDGLKNLLYSYQQLLEAQKSISPGNLQECSTGTTKGKRGRHDMDDDMDIDTERMDDEERFGKRSVFTPFYDVSGR
jgi:serine/threonine/tyrosine-interacting protein